METKLDMEKVAFLFAQKSLQKENFIHKLAKETIANKMEEGGIQKFIADSPLSMMGIGAAIGGVLSGGKKFLEEREREIEDETEEQKKQRTLYDPLTHGLVGASIGAGAGWLGSHAVKGIEDVSEYTKHTEARQKELDKQKEIDEAAKIKEEKKIMEGPGSTLEGSIEIGAGLGGAAGIGVSGYKHVTRDVASAASNLDEAAKRVRDLHAGLSPDQAKDIAKLESEIAAHEARITAAGSVANSNKWTQAEHTLAQSELLKVRELSKDVKDLDKQIAKLTSKNNANTPAGRAVIQRLADQRDAYGRAINDTLARAARVVDETGLSASEYNAITGDITKGRASIDRMRAAGQQAPASPAQIKATEDALFYAESKSRGVFGGIRALMQDVASQQGVANRISAAGRGILRSIFLGHGKYPAIGAAALGAGGAAYHYGDEYINRLSQDAIKNKGK